MLQTFTVTKTPKEIMDTLQPMIDAYDGQLYELSQAYNRAMWKDRPGLAGEIMDEAAFIYSRRAALLPRYEEAVRAYYASM